MSACMKGETTKSQVNLRSGPSASASSITRLPLGAEIEVDYDTPYVTNAEEWYCVAYNNKYLGYMRFDMFKITDRTRKYYMISMLDRYGTSTWVRGHKDADELHIYYVQKDINDVVEDGNYSGATCGEPDGIFGSGTEKAVKDFQKAYELGVDGKVGPNTKAMLYLQKFKHYGWAV